MNLNISALLPLSIVNSLNNTSKRESERKTAAGTACHLRNTTTHFEFSLHLANKATRDPTIAPKYMPTTKRKC